MSIVAHAIKHTRLYLGRCVLNKVPTRLNTPQWSYFTKDRNWFTTRAREIRKSLHFFKAESVSVNAHVEGVSKVRFSLDGK